MCVHFSIAGCGSENHSLAKFLFCCIIFLRIFAHLLPKKDEVAAWIGHGKYISRDTYGRKVRSFISPPVPTEVRRWWSAMPRDSIALGSPMASIHTAPTKSLFSATAHGIPMERASYRSSPMAELSWCSNDAHRKVDSGNRLK